MPKQRDQGLCARVDALVLAPKSEFCAVVQKRSGRQFLQHALRQAKRQACVASFYWMTDLIALSGVKEKYVIGVRYSLITAHVPHVNAAIGVYEVCSRSTL
jgi:hypothetical protein